MKKVFLGLCLFAVASFALAEPFVWPDAWTADAGNEVIGGTLQDASLSSPRTFNPITSAESNEVVDIEQALGAHLLTRGPDSEEWLPYGASSFEISEGGLVVDVTLRDGIKWSDGTPVTIDDYLLTYTLELDEEIGASGRDGWFIEGELIALEATGDNGLRFTFPTTDRLAFSVVGSLLPTSTSIFGTAYEEGGAEAIQALWGTEIDPNETVWTGPWIPTSFSPDERLVMSRNPFYSEWNTDERGNALPYLDSIVYTVADQQAQLNLYLAGELDIYNPANLDEVGLIAVAMDNGDIDATLLENVSPVASSSWFVFNWNKSSDLFKQNLFRDRRFRQAMSHSVDREAIVELVFGGSAIPAYSSVYDALDFWVNRDLPKYEYDPEAALALLSELGFNEKNEEGILIDAEGRPLEFSMATNAGNANREQMLQIVADTMREIGIKVDAQAIDFNLLVDQLLSEGDDRPFDSILLGLSGGSRDWPFGTNTVVCSGNLHMFNRSGECQTGEEAQMEELFFGGRQLLDTDAAKEIGDKLQAVQAELQPIIYTASPLAHYSWASNVAGNHPLEIVNTIVGSRELVLTFVK